MLSIKVGVSLLISQHTEGLTALVSNPAEFPNSYLQLYTTAGCLTTADSNLTYGPLGSEYKVQFEPHVELLAPMQKRYKRLG
jgi:hypothetical protein